MKQKLLWLVLALAGVVHGASPAADSPYPVPLQPAQLEARTAHLAAEVLSRYHYKRTALDDALSVKVFDQYLKSLDSEKLFFIQSDIDYFSAARTQLDDAMKKEDLSIAFAIFNRYQQRASERLTYARSLLANGFDFKVNENYQFARDKQDWSKTEEEIQDIWRKRVKNDWLRLKLAGTADEKIVDLLDKRYDTALKRLGRVKSSDAFQVYMNAFTMAIDPHTNYMGPRAAEDFNISMRLSLVGIGAELSEMDEYTTVRKLVPGGPASLSGKLKVGDRIVGVAQGKDGTMTDVLGWRLDDTVALIRGAADSVVRLDLLPADAGPDGQHKDVSFVRKKISLEEQAAKATVQSVKVGQIMHRVGVVTLASFYEDFEGRQKGVKDYKSATRDVRRLLGELKAKNVDSVLVDLRNNGGGSLSEAIELTGLFVGKGPVVQQRNAKGEISVEVDSRADVVWGGPMGVLINRSSASASEIFAAAIQDYGRGLIIGEPSYGKGTVQNMFDLDRAVKNDTPQFGELKMTIAQFFRINGGTTQLRGVTPDILFPAVSDAQYFGESSYDNALPWLQIKAASYAPRGDLKGMVPVLTSLHETRVQKDKAFQYFKEDIAESKALREKNLISLNESDRRQERDRQAARLVLRESMTPTDQAPVLQDDGLQADERRLTQVLASETQLKNSKDVLLDEAVQVLSDHLTLLQARVTLASRPKQGAALVQE
jgi:carboxyl-terminal processing protease